MKFSTKYFALPLIFASATALAQHSLTVNISNVKPGRGTVELGIFNKEQGYLKHNGQLAKKSIKATGSSLSYTFTDLPPGNYAVAAYQDENGNGKCDTNFLGIPTEVFGFSNNVRPKLAPPSFKDTKVAVPATKAIGIKMAKY